MQLQQCDDHDDVFCEVMAILAEHFPNGLDSPTDQAIAAGRVRTINRDAANDEA